MPEEYRTGSPRMTASPLVRFHTTHKLTLMAHSPKHYTQMGRLVADAGKRDWDELTAGYGAMLMEGLGVMGTRGKHVNVLQHLMGYLKNHITADDKQELLGFIEDYRQGLPISTRTPSWSNCRSRCHLWWDGFCQGARQGRAALNRYPVPDWMAVPSVAWVPQQVYLHPYPKLMLRNHV